MLVADSSSLFNNSLSFVDFCSIYNSNSYLCLSINMKNNFKEHLERVKNKFLLIGAKVVSFVIYWVGVSVSYLLWKLSSLFKKEQKDSYLMEYEDKEDYWSQY